MSGIEEAESVSWKIGSLDKSDLGMSISVKQIMTRLPLIGGMYMWRENGLLNECFRRVRDIHGAYAEFGVFQGSTFLKIARQAKKHNKTAFAFDSFQGLAEPEEIDNDPSNDYRYPKGKFDVGGPSRFMELLRQNGFDNYKIVEGYIPDTLSDAMDVTFCFAHIDLDHYRPTVHAARWCFDRLSQGGVIIFDDYFKGRRHLATPAIDEFMEEHRDEIDVGRTSGQKIFITKKVALAT